MKISLSIVVTSTLFGVLQAENSHGDASAIISTNNSRNETAHVRKRRRRTVAKIPAVCPPLPSGSGTVEFSLAESQINIMYEAVILNRLATNFLSGPIDWWIEEEREIYELLEGFSSVGEQTVVAKTEADGACHAVFGPGINPLDQWQNIDPSSQTIPGSDCVVRGGFYDSYFNSYYEEFKTSLETCLNSCPNLGQCPLVLSGYSQGGAVAVIAAVDLRDYNPTIVSFGGTQAIIPREGQDCTNFPAKNHYQMVTTLVGTYDAISVQPNPFSARHYGHMLLLTEDTTGLVIGYPGMNMGDDIVRFPFQNGVHYIGFYETRLRNLRDRGCFPVPVGKWGEGHWCHYDDECDSGNCGFLTCQA